MFSLKEVEAGVGPQDEPPPHPPGGCPSNVQFASAAAAAAAHLPEVSAGDDPEGVVEAVEGASHGRVGLRAGGDRLAVLVLHSGQAEFEHVSSCERISKHERGNSNKSPCPRECLHYIKGKSEDFFELDWGAGNENQHYTFVKTTGKNIRFNISSTSASFTGP